MATMQVIVNVAAVEAPVLKELCLGRMPASTARVTHLDVEVGCQTGGHTQVTGQHFVDLGSEYAYVDSARDNRQYTRDVLDGPLQVGFPLDLVEVQVLPLKPAPPSYRALPLELAQLQVRSDDELHERILDV
jgi:hypothetical protein